MQDIMASELFHFSTSTLNGKSWRKWITKNLEKGKSFLGGEIKAFLNIFLRAFFWWNIQIVDITFNVDVNLNLLQSKRVYGTQSNIYDGAFWEKIVNGLSIVDVPLGSKYVSVVFLFFHYWGICGQIWRVL